MDSLSPSIPMQRSPPSKSPSASKGRHIHKIQSLKDVFQKPVFRRDTVKPKESSVNLNPEQWVPHNREQIAMQLVISGHNLKDKVNNLKNVFEKCRRLSLHSMTNHLMAFKGKTPQSSETPIDTPQSQLAKMDQEDQFSQLMRLNTSSKDRHMIRQSVRMVRHDGSLAPELKLEDMSHSKDLARVNRMFITTMLVPYLTEVFESLIDQFGQAKKGYLKPSQMLRYLNLPSLLGNRIIEQINANGDQRIEHDEFLSFFLKLLMGSPEQKLLIVFKCFDFDNVQEAASANVELLLKHIPHHQNAKYGISTPTEDEHGYSLSNDAQHPIFEVNQRRMRDHEEIRQLVDLIFSQFKSVMYFNEFKYLTEFITGELAFSVLDTIYHEVPFIHNFLIMKTQFYAIYGYLAKHYVQKEDGQIRKRDSNLDANFIQGKMFVDQCLAFTQKEVRTVKFSQPILEKSEAKMNYQPERKFCKADSLHSNASAYPEIKFKKRASIRQRQDSSLDLLRKILSSRSVLESKKESQKSSNSLESSEQTGSIMQEVERLKQLQALKRSSRKSSGLTLGAMVEEMAKGQSRNSRNMSSEIHNQTQQPHAQNIFRTKRIEGVSSPLAMVQPGAPLSPQQVSGRKSLFYPGQSSTEKLAGEMRSQRLSDTRIKPYNQSALGKYENFQQSFRIQEEEDEALSLSSSVSQSPMKPREVTATRLELPVGLKAPQTQRAATALAGAAQPNFGFDPRSRNQSSLMKTKDSTDQKVITVTDMSRKNKSPTLPELSKFSKVGTSDGRSSHALRKRRHEDDTESSVDLSESDKETMEQRMLQIRRQNAQKKNQSPKFNATIFQIGEDFSQGGNQFLRQNLINRITTFISSSNKSEDSEDSEQVDSEEIFSDIMNRLTTHQLKVTDVFGNVIRRHNYISRGPAVEKTESGFYKRVYLGLVNTELYVYPDEKARGHKLMMVLTPNVYFQQKEQVSIHNPRAQFQACKTLFPLEISLADSGKTVFKKPATIILYFEQAQVRTRWYNQLIRVTGNFKIQDHYQLTDSNKMATDRINSESPNRQSRQPKKRSSEATASNFKSKELLKSPLQKLRVVPKVEGIEKAKKASVEGTFTSMEPSLAKQFLQASHKTHHVQCHIKMIRKAAPVEEKRSNEDSLRPFSPFDQAQEEDKTQAKLAQKRVNQAHVEITLLKILSHPNISRMTDYFENKDFIFICREFLQGEPISAFLSGLKEKEGNLDEFKMRAIFRSMVETVDFLHGMGIVVRNLCLDSFIISETKSDKDSFSHPKLWNMEQITILYQGEKTSGQFGEEAFQAPEVVSGSPYDKKADTWALGVILFTMIIGRSPFSNFYAEQRSFKQKYRRQKLLTKPEMSDIGNQILRSDFSRLKCEDLLGFGGQTLSSSLKDLISKLLEKQPIRRLSSKQILDHPWFKEQRQAQKSPLPNLSARMQNLLGMSPPRSGAGPGKLRRFITKEKV